VTKPFNLRELVLRVGAVLSRSRGERGRSAVVGDDGLKLDPMARVVIVDGREVQLTGREFDLLHFLVTHPNRVLSRAELLRQVWEYDFEGFDRTVDAHVARLRRKLGRPGDWIETAWGIGYSYRPPSG
jgi:two-component system phosphate regulon response regulator PhoB